MMLLDGEPMMLLDGEPMMLSDGETIRRLTSIDEYVARVPPDDAMMIFARRFGEVVIQLRRSLNVAKLWVNGIQFQRIAYRVSHDYCSPSLQPIT